MSKFFAILPVAAIVLILWEIDIYRLTFISWWIPVAVGVVAGVIVTPLFRKYIDRLFPGHELPAHLAYNIVTWGGIVMFLFMWSNTLFAAKRYRTVNEKIVESGYLASKRAECKQPYCNILYNGLHEQLVFPCGTAIETFKSVDLTLADGFLGFPVVVDKTLRR